MKAMKIRITDEEHSRQVQEALFAAGYAWCGVNKTAIHTAAKFLFGGTFGGNEITYDWDDEKYFLEHKATEHFLHNNRFVTELPPEQPTKPLENIFIKLDSTTTKEVARKALEDAGYALDGIPPELFAAVTCDYVTGNFDGAIGYGNLSVPPSKYQERFVWQGRLVSENYFAAPVTLAGSPAQPDNREWCQGCNPWNCTGCGEAYPGREPVWEPLDEPSFTAAPDSPPLGLKPRKIHDQDRLIEILQACLRYADDGKQVPSEWWAEAQYLNNLMEVK